MYGYYHSLDGATLFSTVDLNKLCQNVHNKETLISAKFGADLITISKDTDHKTKWPRFLAYPVNNKPVDELARELLSFKRPLVPIALRSGNY